MKADIIIAVGQHLIWVSINGRGNSISTKSDTKLRALLFNTVLKYSCPQKKEQENVYNAAFNIEN